MHWLLETKVPTASGTFLIRLAEALSALTEDQAWADLIVSILTGADDFGERVDAAVALAGFAPTAHLVRALARAVRDDDYLVRYHAATTLLRYAGHGGDVTDDPAIFTKIKMPTDGPPSRADRAAWQNAADELSTRALSHGF
jgi:hypothetical protein